MLQNVTQCFAISLVFCTLGVESARSQSFLKRFLPVDRVETTNEEGFELTDRQGPWLIMAATFSGDGAEDQARDLTLEFRRRFNLPAYLHDMTFQAAGDVGGRGIDNYGAPIRRRYQQDEPKREWAVLVGNFTTIDHPQAQQLLKRIKTIRPAALEVAEGEVSAQSLSEVRKFHEAVLARVGRGRQKGPMSGAFMAPNPLVPREYFTQQGVDKFVLEMNEGVKHSLLDCNGKYTVKVATFRGSSILQTAGTKDSDRRQKSGLVIAAENAALLTAELRKHDWDAYEFHDREESIVTIGSFDRPGRRLPDGRVVPTQDAEFIIRTFGAAYDTPSDPLYGDDLTNRRMREEALQHYTSSMADQHGQMATGLNPKHVKILKGRKLRRTIPMDIYPQVIEAPKRSISGAYFRN